MMSYYVTAQIYYMYLMYCDICDICRRAIWWETYVLRKKASLKMHIEIDNDSSQMQS